MLPLLKFKLGDLVRHVTTTTKHKNFYKNKTIAELIKNEFVGMIIVTDQTKREYNTYRVRWFKEPQPDPYWYEETSLELI